MTALAMAAALLSGCRSDIRTVPRAAPAGVEDPAPRGSSDTGLVALAPMGYTIQVGAFAVLDNARALAERLGAAGLEAFYFPSGSGLFKVRFGNFSSREAAIAEARRLRSEGRLTDFFVIGPSEYAVTWPGAPGSGSVRPRPRLPGLRDRLAATAESFIGVDYAWGGTTTRSGFDCSGLVLAVYQLNGLAMPRSVRDQHRAGTEVQGDRLEKGDLLFFSGSPGGGLTHVGIYIGGGVFIHAPGSGKQVRRESLAGSYFRSHFAGARTYL